MIPTRNIIPLLISISSCLSTNVLFPQNDEDDCSIKGLLGKCLVMEKCKSLPEDLAKQAPCGFDGRSPKVCCPKTSKAKEKCVEFAEKYGLGFDPIVKGADAGAGEFPFMAALGFGDGEVRWQCGGSLISEKFVLTAAHCLVSQLGPVSTVRLGDVYVDGSSGTKQDFRIAKAVVHPDYKPPMSYNDIALLELQGEVNISDIIRPGCLQTEALEDLAVWATGWGLTDYGGSSSNTLQKVILEGFSKEECDKVHTFNSRKLPKGILYDRQICVGSKKDERDTCRGDSGGPLVGIDTKNIIGVTSFGKACGVPGLPAVYTNVTYYLPWIEGLVWP